ncbi:MAG TPA: aspartate carbamoyltransferase [bacterium]|nr:aspartate carbamoyltransferase [bacterium]HOL47028.1 aspartate carbamoyltransferase [bacterium]HPQ18470.1 aspartate carbamoyltransferase [bacterium]
MKGGLEIDIISMSDFNREQIEFILETARNIKKATLNNESTYKGLLNNIKIATAFTEISTRTNLSSRTAGFELGSIVDGFSSGEATSLGKGESWADTLRMLIGYRNRIIVMRHHLDGSARWASIVSDMAFEDEKRKCPEDVSRRRTMIVNGGDGKNQHPTQCLLDLFTIKEILGRLDDFDLGLFNDLKYGRTTHSLITIAPLFKNIRLHLAFPPGFGPEKHYIDFLKRNKVQFFIYDNIFEALEKVDIAYVTRFQKERFRDENERKNIGKNWSITLDLLKKLNIRKNMKILHPLPIDKEMQEIHYSVNNSEYAYYYQQATNGMYVREAIYGLITGKISSTNIPIYHAEKSDTNIKIIELPVHIHKKELQNPRSGYIDNDGIVIDHIAVNRARRLAGFLGFEHNETIPLTLAKCLQSKSGKKDMLKIHTKYELSERDLLKIAIISPSARISIIENGKVKRKISVQLPDKIDNLIYCNNEKCISNPIYKEGVVCSHYVISTDPLIIKCLYCENEMSFETIWNNKLFIYD